MSSALRMGSDVKAQRIPGLGPQKAVHQWEEVGRPAGGHSDLGPSWKSLAWFPTPNPQPPTPRAGSAGRAQTFTVDRACWLRCGTWQLDQSLPLSEGWGGAQALVLQPGGENRGLDSAARGRSQSRSFQSICTAITTTPSVQGTH